jgi:hypothetical protein
LHLVELDVVPVEHGPYTAPCHVLEVLQWHDEAQASPLDQRSAHARLSQQPRQCLDSSGYWQPTYRHVRNAYTAEVGLQGQKTNVQGNITTIVSISRVATILIIDYC